ncbi:SDR family oxidoreductase [Mycolicibacterium sp. P1-18]|uniref:SDR family oxidoreductase n=1 Tax=Mycolicibacterium sp. P1-18 TaxID=2024615 RepID=UPI0011F33D98|nr:SDR family oxidoreductase [Mycolicibacterium sp. P1-18]KAA0092336.1 SDR family oxidoreductase [Mycolicibacterium sp. P1-18]
MVSVAGKVVFITGGAAGVGAEVARRLHGRGARLVLTDVDADALARFAATLGDERVLTVTADVRDLPAMQAAADAAVQRFGGVDVVVANAGIASYGSVLQVDPAAFKRLLDVNVLGVFHTVRATLPSIVDRRGYVLVVSSLAAFTAAPGLAPYNASKAAVEQFANALRLEVAHHGVDVGSAHMSWVDTAMVRDTKTDLSTFGEMLSKLPYPVNVTTSVEKCGAAFVDGIENRKSRVYCPRWVGVLRWLKPVMSTRLGEAPVKRFVPDLLPRMDAEVVALGRSTSAHSETLDAPNPM